MAGTRANWFIEDLLTLDDDGVPAPSVSEVGTKFDLRDVDTLASEVTRLLGVENELYNHGIRCSIKQEPGAHEVTCSICPVRRHGEEDPVRVLCDLGAEQEQTKTAWKIATELAPHAQSLPGS